MIAAACCIGCPTIPRCTLQTFGKTHSCKAGWIGCAAPSSTCPSTITTCVARLTSLCAPPTLGTRHTLLLFIVPRGLFSIGNTSPLGAVRNLVVRWPFPGCGPPVVPMPQLFSWSPSWLVKEFLCISKAFGNVLRVLWTVGPCRPCRRRLGGYRAATDGAVLLAFQPRTQAVHVVAVSAWQLLGFLHFFPAHGTCPVCPFQVLFRGVGEQRVDVRCDLPVLQEEHKPVLEVAERPVQVSHEMQGQSVVGQDHGEERQVHDHVKEIHRQFEVEEGDPFSRPRSFRVHVRHVDPVFADDHHHRRAEDGVFECEQEEHRRTGIPGGPERVVQEHHVDDQEDGEEGQ
mmetsp:Transcript_5928/g.36758  ORF Transcript_5928/g.36758 Transcript_5928/m.36758 type:complete len:343 (+) Transcript_5928:350-1378(+)